MAGAVEDRLGHSLVSGQHGEISYIVNYHPGRTPRHETLDGPPTLVDASQTYPVRTRRELLILQNTHMLRSWP
jgi:hypothetical protein